MNDLPFAIEALLYFLAVIGIVAIILVGWLFLADPPDIDLDD